MLHRTIRNDDFCTMTGVKICVYVERLTLLTLIDKYVHNHNEKISVCLFRRFQKTAFDSVWHNVLLTRYKLMLGVVFII